MDSQPCSAPTLDSIPASRQLVEELYDRRLISSEARLYALEQIHPPEKWNHWLPGRLLEYGTALLLSGIMFFLSWRLFSQEELAIIPATVRLAFIPTSILAFVAIARWLGLQKFTSAILMVSAFVLTVVFLGACTVVYQIEDQAGLLYFLWALLTLPLVLLAEIPFLWIFWTCVANSVLACFCQQFLPVSRETSALIYSLCALLNTLFLAIREYRARKKPDTGNSWARPGLVIVILFLLVFPLILSLASLASRGPAVVTGWHFCVSAVIHGIFYYIWRYRMPDLRCLAATVVSFCITVELMTILFMIKSVKHILYLLFALPATLAVLMGITFAAFMPAVKNLLSAAKEMENK